jgi:hypothetical protein
MPQSRGRLFPLIALPLILVGACTFPDVDFADPLAAACTMPPACDVEIDTCSKQAETQRGSCLAKCGMGPTADCTACQSEHNSAVSICVAQCESCSSANGCTNATDSCKALLGAP